jgi:hypothetical protein
MLAGLSFPEHFDLAGETAACCSLPFPTDVWCWKAECFKVTLRDAASAVESGFTADLDVV